jgi:hypothetical protein
MDKMRSITSSPGNNILEYYTHMHMMRYIAPHTRTVLDCTTMDTMRYIAARPGNSVLEDYTHMHMMRYIALHIEESVRLHYDGYDAIYCCSPWKF